MSQKEVNVPANAQESHLLNTLPFVRKFVGRKLNSLYREYIEDVSQTVIVNLLKWRQKYPAHQMSEEEWLRFANVTAQNEVNNFHRSKLNREIPESEEEIVYLIDRVQFLENQGKAGIEISAIMQMIWNVFQGLSLRQKYALLFQNKDLVIELLVNRCCSVADMASSLEMGREEFAIILEEIPLSEERIKGLLEEKLGFNITSKQIWSDRDKAKRRLFENIKTLL